MLKLNLRRVRNFKAAQKIFPKVLSGTTFWGDSLDLLE